MYIDNYSTTVKCVYHVLKEICYVFAVDLNNNISHSGSHLTCPTGVTSQDQVHPQSAPEHNGHIKLLKPSIPVKTCHFFQPHSKYYRNQNNIFNFFNV